MADAAAPTSRAQAASARPGRRAQKRQPAGGRKKVVVGVAAVAAVAVVGLGVAFGVSMLGGKGAAPAELTVGQCVNWEGITDVVKRAPNPVIVTDCAKPHDGEIIATGQVPEGFDFLSRHEVVIPVCSEAFDTYVGIPFAQSSLAGSYYDAPQPKWEAGERAFACIAHAPDGSKLEGSVKNSQR